MLHHCRDILSGIIELLSPDPLLAPHVNICHALQAEVHRFPSFGKQTYYYLLFFFFKHMMTGVFRGFIGCVNPDGFILVWCYDITEQMVLKWHFWTDRNQEILETVSNVHILPLGFFFMFLCHPINLPHPKKRINNYQTFSFVTNLPLRLNHCVIHRCVTNLQQRTFQELEWFLRGFQISRKKTGNRIQ